jgi:hypothetical protein
VRRQERATDRAAEAAIENNVTREVTARRTLVHISSQNVATICGPF